MKIVTGRIAPSIPLVALDTAISVARKVQEHDGHLTRHNLAIALGMKKASGNANNRILGAQRFNLIQRSAEGRYAITDLGRACIVERPSQDAVLDAIRSVRFFAAVLDELGRNLTVIHHHVIDEELRRAGLPEKSVVDGRRVLLRSLEALNGAEEVSQTPAIEKKEDAAPVEPPAEVRVSAQPEERAGTDEDAVETTSLPFIDIPVVRGLLDAAPACGRPWPKEQQARFIEALRHIISFTYSDG